MSRVRARDKTLSETHPGLRPDARFAYLTCGIRRSSWRNHLGETGVRAQFLDGPDAGLEVPHSVDGPAASAGVTTDIAMLANDSATATNVAARKDAFNTDSDFMARLIFFR